MKIETSLLLLEEDTTRSAEKVSAGKYVCVKLRDDGVGMEPEVLEKVFEPFFTTKDVGEGTGLGLATIYGIVRQNGGFIVADSEPGKGTEFSVHLPLHD